MGKSSDAEIIRPCEKMRHVTTELPCAGKEREDIGNGAGGKCVFQPIGVKDGKGGVD